MRRILKEMMPSAATIIALNVVRDIFGQAVSLAVGITALIGILALFWYEGGKLPPETTND